ELLPDGDAIDRVVDQAGAGADVQRADCDLHAADLVLRGAGLCRRDEIKRRRGCLRDLRGARAHVERERHALAANASAPGDDLNLLRSNGGWPPAQQDFELPLALFDFGGRLRGDDKAVHHELDACYPLAVPRDGVDQHVAVAQNLRAVIGRLHLNRRQSAAGDGCPFSVLFVVTARQVAGQRGCYQRKHGEQPQPEPSTVALMMCHASSSKAKIPTLTAFTDGFPSIECITLPASLPPIRRVIAGCVWKTVP